MNVSSVFGYAPDVVARYPDLSSSAAVFEVAASPSSGDQPTRAWLDEAATRARGHLDGRRPNDLSEVRAWREVFASFGATPSKHRSAVEALQRRVAGGHDIPSINPFVDVGNAVSLEHRVPVAVFDLTALADRISVRFADGGETFLPIGGGPAETAEPGEIVFTDPDTRCWARRWCWRQAGTGATSRDTRQVLAVIEAHHDGARSATAEALASLTSRLAEIGARVT